MRAKCGWNGNAIYVSQPNKFDTVVCNTFGVMCALNLNGDKEKWNPKKLDCSAEIYRDH